MSKVEIKFELTGLKFEITGERDNVATALAALQQQINALANSAAAASGSLEGQVPQSAKVLSLQPGRAVNDQATDEFDGRAPVSQGTRSRSKRVQSGLRTKVEPVQFSHDAEKYGFPKQEWNTANKAMWLLYVVEMQTEQKEASAPVLAATFKYYFKEFGNLLAHNISRDLGGAKKKGLVNSDPAKNPETWYLLAAGKTAMQALIVNPTAAEETTTQ